MGHHNINPDREYKLLQRNLDKNVTGAPYSPTFLKILKLLFSPEEANLARQMPVSVTSVKSLARKLNVPLEKLQDQVTVMAEKGLVIDIDMKGKRFVMLAPVVIGFFEYTFMRTRDDAPMKELAELFETYMKHEDKFAHAVFQGNTQIGRSMVREEALDENYTEILDYEKASHIIDTATDWAVSLCACRHHHTHLGDACEADLRTCLTMNIGADPMVKAGIAERITKAEAFSILDKCKEQGLAQTADNVKANATYMCNCCGCCCGMMQAIKTHNINNAIVSSNYIMSIDLDSCKGCGKCAKACPVDAIEVKKIGDGKGKNRWAEVNEDLCLGCGVCYSSCKHDSISMKPREKRVYTPDSVFDKTVVMAIERGKLAPLIFSDPTKLSHRALGRVIQLLEKSPPYKAAMAIEPLKSTFLRKVVSVAKKQAGF